jgi:3',5'-cyclic-AMP phosphodiesterase
MPFLLDRRGFIQAGIAGLSLRAVQAAPESVRLALLSDTHIAADNSDTYRGFSPHANLKKVLEQVTAKSFDFGLVNGDLARLNGEAADYVAFAGYFNTLADKMPALVTLGNHDDRKNARSALAQRAGDVQSVEQKFVTTLDAGPCNLVMLDSLMVTNIAAGQVGRKQRDWLAAYLDAHSTKPQIVFVHHNPDPESDGALVDAERLLAILRPRRQVKALFFGHTHVYSLSVQDGLHLVNLPAVGYNFADGNPVGWIEAAFTPRSATLQLHAIAGDTADDGKTRSLSWR